MKTYKLTVESKKNGVVFNTHEMYVTMLLKPKVGDGRKLLTDPPTFQTIVKVEKVDKGTFIPPRLK